MRYINLLIGCAVFALAAPAWAGLVETHFPGKSEATVAADFEAGLGAFLDARIKEPAIVVRMYAPVAKNVEAHVQLKSVEGARTTWTTLVKVGWIKERSEYSYDVFGKDYAFEIAKLPPAEVANWFQPKSRTAADVVACACWLASKGELLLANGRVAALATHNKTLKKEVDEWLAARNGWTVPADGLPAFETHDLKHNEDGVFFFTKEAAAAYYKEIDKVAKDALKELEKLQGNDLKSKPGNRKNSPGMRLEILQKYVERFAKAYQGTATMGKKGAETVQEISDAVKADLEWIEAEKYKAERKGIDGDFAGAAKHFELLKRADPLNPDLVLATAEAFNKAAKLSDGGRKAEDPAAAKRAAQTYEELLEIYPKVLGFRNHAGVNWLGAGDKAKSKEHHEEVMRRTEGKKPEEMTESEKSNRAYAETQLALIK